MANKESSTIVVFRTYRGGPDPPRGSPFGEVLQFCGEITSSCLKQVGECWCTKRRHFLRPWIFGQSPVCCSFECSLDFPHEDWLVNSLTLLNADGCHRNEKVSVRQQ